MLSATGAENMAVVKLFCAFCLLTFVDARKSGTEKCFANSTANYTTFQENKHEFFVLNKGANIKCSNKTWREMIYSIWNLKMIEGHCCLAFQINKSHIDTCKDGKELRNGTNGETYLHIPHFTLRDQGTYRCDTTYWGGDYIAEITVSARVPPEIYNWLDELHNRMVAVCLAVGGNPAASISWRTTWNSTANNIITRNKNGTYTVESRIILPDHVSKGNLSCVISHPSWTGELRELNFSDSKAAQLGNVTQWIGLSVSVCIIIILAGFYLTWRHLSKIRNHCKTSIPAPTPPKDVQHVQEVEELEPYASYVQRVNSIYNSSAELCRS